jgi:hypothetical protein
MIFHMVIRYETSETSETDKKGCIPCAAMRARMYRCCLPRQVRACARDAQRDPIHFPVSSVSLVSCQQRADNKELLRRNRETSARNRLVSLVSSLIQFIQSSAQLIDLMCGTRERSFG